MFIVKKGQYLAFIKEYPDQPRLDITRAGEANIKFGNGTLIKLLETITINTFFGPVNFYIIKLNTFFLILFKNMDRLSIYLNNIIN